MHKINFIHSYLMRRFNLLMMLLLFIIINIQTDVRLVV